MRPLRPFALLSALIALSGCVSAPPKPAQPPPDPGPLAPFELEETSIAELQRRMTAGELSSQAVTRLYLERIARLDAAGPRLKAVIETNPDALAIAQTLDAERAAGKLRGPLHGVPVLLKDNIDTADAMQTSAGSLETIAGDEDLLRQLLENKTIPLFRIRVEPPF